MMSAVSSLKYRTDIDGLRAIAVLAVIVFHLSKDWLPGGFVGVDVFFVISGYLITGLIVREVQTTGRFDFRRFYYRRLRRLFPAMAVVTIATLVVGAMVFPPELMASLGGSTIAAIFSVSNVFFWTQSGYFDAANNLKPLLHTWSLSVEEQFYLIWPALLVGTMLWIRQGWVLIVLGVGAASFAANLIWQGDLSLIFYLLPFRAFELCIGALLVWMEGRFRTTGWRAELIYLGGLATIVASVATLREGMVFPSYNALLPCVGAAMMIFTGGHSSLAQILTKGPAAAIGKISYSLYLVHWPIIVLYAYGAMIEPDNVARLGIFVATIVCGAALYALVENPIRTGKALSIPLRFAMPASLAAIILAAGGYNAWISGGWTWRYNPEILRMMDEGTFLEADRFNPLDGCFLGDTLYRKDIPAACYTPASNDPRPSVILVGDSTANHLTYGLHHALGDDVQLFIWASSSCAPFYKETEFRPQCKENNAEFFDRLLTEFKYDLVLFSSHNAANLYQKDFAVTAQRMKGLGVQYAVFGQSLLYREAPRLLLARFGLGSDLTERFSSQLLMSCDDEHGIDTVVAPERFFSVADALCENGLPIYQVDGRLLQIDGLHFTDYGSRFVGQKIAHWLESNHLLASSADK